MVDHYVSRVSATMQLLQQHDIIGRTSELARVFGIQFLHVLTRGSQVRPPGGHAARAGLRLVGGGGAGLTCCVCVCVRCSTGWSP